MPLPTYLMSNFPSVRPSLNLQFDSQPTPEDMTSHLASVGATFSRASIGTYTDANGIIQEATSGQARPNYSSAGVHEGLLIEESRTNLLAYSEDATITNWNNEANITVTTNAIDAPDGNTTADLVAGTASTSLHYLGQNRSLSSSTTYTQSAFVKAEALDYCYLLVNESGSFGNRTQAYFNLSNGTLDSSFQGGDFTLVNTDIVDVSNGWYRISMTFTTGTLTAGIIRFGISDDGSTSSSGFLGDGSGVYMWGFQLEEGSFLTSYIPTSGNTATRSADVCYIDGTAFTDFYNDDEGTIFSNYQIKGIDALSTVLSFNDQTNNNKISMFANVSDDRKRVDAKKDNVTQVLSDIDDITVDTFEKLAFSYKLNDTLFIENGNTTTEKEDDIFTPPTSLSVLDIGNDNFGDRHLKGTIKKLIYFPRALSDNELNKLTQ